MRKSEILNLNVFLFYLFLIIKETLGTSMVSKNVSNSEEFIKANSTLRIRKTGTCTNGYVYKIVNVEELYDLETHLECLLHSGLALSKVPEGSSEGKTLALVDTTIFNPIVDFVWRGNTITHLNCPSAINQMYSGYNNFLNYPIVPFAAYLGKFTGKVTPGEHTDDKMSLFLDYSADFRYPCQINNDSDLWWNNLLDMVRFVGRQQDGGAILLAKTFFKDHKGLYSTVLYFYMVNYDPLLNPDFTSGQGLPPLESSFVYSIPGL